MGGGHRVYAPKRYQGEILHVNLENIFYIFIDKQIVAKWRVGGGGGVLKKCSYFARVSEWTKFHHVQRWGHKSFAHSICNFTPPPAPHPATDLNNDYSLTCTCMSLIKP